MKVSPLFSKVETSSSYLENEEDRASIGGIVTKTFILVFITAIIAVATSILLIRILEANAAIFIGALIGAAILSFIFCIAGRLSDKAARVCSVGYALCEGLLVGTITGLVELYVSGAGIICTFATLIIFLSLLGLYAVGFLRVDTKEGVNFFKMIFKFMIAFLIIGLLLAIFSTIVYFVGNVDKDMFPLYLLIELIFLAYGIFSLTLSFGEASAVINSGCSKQSEWSVALGMEVSLIYIYIRMLRLVLLTQIQLM